MAYGAKIVLDSVNEAGDRLTTMEVTMPWAILATFNTYRDLTVSVVSGQFDKQLESVRFDSYAPTRLVDGAVDPYFARGGWKNALSSTLHHIDSLLRTGVKKENLAPLLMPFAWCTVVVTATRWERLFWLIDDEYALPELKAVATVVRNAHTQSEPTVIKDWGWHLPYVQDEERNGYFERTERAFRISAARCDRACSNLTGDSKFDVDEPLRRYDELIKTSNLAPLDHVATPYVEQIGGPDGEYVSAGRIGNVKGWRQRTKFHGEFIQ